MASSINPQPLSLFFLFTLFLFATSSPDLSHSPLSTSMNKTLSYIKSFCKTTPHPDACFDSLKLSISIDINGNSILSFLLQTLQAAIFEAGKLSNLFLKAGNLNLVVEKQRGAVQDCTELHQITLSSLRRSVAKIKAQDPKKLADARAYLSAALTNKFTCLEGLDSASGPLKPAIVSLMADTYKHVSNALSKLPKPAGRRKGRRLMGFPKWLSRKDRRILQEDGGDDDDGDMLTVAADGTGNFSTITEAISFAPNNSYDRRTFIYVKEGVYAENVEIPSWKMNIVLFGDGSDVTFITGNRSVADGWTTFRSATLAVSGEGFLARDISIENTAGPAKHQAAALRVNADYVALYRCAIYGYQDSLYAHSFRQFYRECDIYGTIDYIFGNAAAVFQACNIISRMPLPGQSTVIAAQSRDSADEDTGISIQNCSVLATDDLSSDSGAVKSYLGRPWKVFARTVFLESYIDGFIDPNGWAQWPGDQQGINTLYYGEYGNYGPGSITEGRVTWPGYHVMDYYDAYNFTVTEFIMGDEWLGSTSFPYDDGI